MKRTSAFSIATERGASWRSVHLHVRASLLRARTRQGSFLGVRKYNISSPWLVHRQICNRSRYVYWDLL